MAVRAIRGATQLERDDRDHLLERVSELMAMVLDDNELDADQLISVIFTATDDVHSEFPAYAARRLGLVDVPLLCARELQIEGSLPRIVRVMAHVDTDVTRSEITHVYLHGAASLRRDLARVASHDDAPKTRS
ncbi:MAG TPA: chorismate mutase [Nocardioidaceae bacterium]|nr:chorismate mutase [Nocardioidaceae bacterium]